MFTQLNPPLPLYVIGRGNGLAHGVIDDGIEHNLLWVVILDSDGSIWCEPNTRVRGRWNYSAGRVKPITIEPLDSVG